MRFDDQEMKNSEELEEVVLAGLEPDETEEDAEEEEEADDPAEAEEEHL